MTLRERYTKPLLAGFSIGAVEVGWYAFGRYAPGLAWGQWAVVYCALAVTTTTLVVARWPRAEALRQVLRLRPGQRVEAEGRPAGRLWARAGRKG